MKFKLFVFYAGFSFFFATQISIFAAERIIHVSPEGPVSTFQATVDEVRKLPKTGGPIVVEFEQGTYFIEEPVVFRPEDSGTADSPIVYRAKKDAEVVINGGRRILGWEKGGNGVWTTKIDTDWRFEQLYIDGKRATRARTPNENYFYTTEKDENRERDAFFASPADIAPLKNVPINLLNDVVFTVFHSWETSAHRLKGIEFEKNSVVFTGPAAWPLMNWEPRQRYYYENAACCLDAPGEWYLHCEGTLSYVPFPNEDMNKAEAFAPVSDAFMLFEGNILKDKESQRISNISFEGLKFKYCGYTLEPQGHSDPQAALRLPFAVKLEGCEKISFENCEFAHIGGNGIRFHQACTDNRFVKNYVHDIGGGGIYVGYGHHPDWNLVSPTERNLIDNCIIRDGGKFDKGAVGVWIGHASWNKVLHNDISEFYYTGISVGWQWGYQSSLSRENTIEFNHIHHLGHWVMSDMGGVYTLGVSPGTTVSNNVMHDIYAYSYGGWGLYTDEGSTGIVLENNLVYRVKTGTFHQHYGKENIVRNNILAYSLTDQIQRSRIEEHLSFFLENNIIIWDKDAVLFGHPWSDDTLSRWGDKNVAISNNLYWSDGADMSKVFPANDAKGNDLETWRNITGHDKGSIVADPKFKDPKNGDFTLPDDSPAFKIGFKRFDYSKAGVYGDKNWIDLAKDYDHPERPLPPEKPRPLPLVLNDDFESPRKTPMPKGTIHDHGKNMVRISEVNPAGGKKCLEIADSDEMPNTYDPHITFTPRYSEGTIRNEFSLRTAKNAEPFIEFRDAASPYKIGPSIRIRGGKLYVKGIEPIDFPLDTWVGFEITAKIDKNPAGTWSLTLRFPDGKEKRLENLKFEHPEWNKLEWYGLCNLAHTAEESSFFIDNLKLKNDDVTE